MKKFTPQQKRASDEIIRRTGEIRQLLTSGQKAFYDLIKNGNQYHYGLYASRKVGKTLFLLLYSFEHCYKTRNGMVRFMLPTLKQARDIIFPMYNELRDLIPVDMMPVLFKSEGAIKFPNGAQIVLGGTTSENVESSRGPRATMLVCDEIAAFDAANYDYALNSILIPQLSTTRGIRLDCTTPARSPNHPWIQQTLPLLKSKNCLTTFDIYKNDLLSKEDIEIIIERYGGADNPNFLREYCLELIADSSLLLVPEFNLDTHVGDTNIPKTDHFGNPQIMWSGVSLDVGLVDNSAILGGYYNPTLDKLIIENEFMNNQMTLSQIAHEWNKIYNIYSMDPECMEPTGIIDVFEVAAHTLRHEHKLNFRRPQKAKIEESINFLRDCFKNDKILISPNCKGLIEELKNGIWKANRTDVERTDKGHNDAIMALIYLCRAVPFGRKATDKPASALTFKNISRARR